MQKIEEAARLWNKTKDPRYKNLWYKLIKEYTNGFNNMERRVVPITSSNKADNGRNRSNS